MLHNSQLFINLISFCNMWAIVSLWQTNKFLPGAAEQWAPLIRNLHHTSRMYSACMAVSKNEIVRWILAIYHSCFLRNFWWFLHDHASKKITSTIPTELQKMINRVGIWSWNSPAQIVQYQASSFAKHSLFFFQLQFISYTKFPTLDTARKLKEETHHAQTSCR